MALAVGADGGGARLVVEQRELAEIVAGGAARQGLLLPGLRDHHLALDDDVEVGAWERCGVVG